MHTYNDDDYPGTPSDVRQVGETARQFRERIARRRERTERPGGFTLLHRPSAHPLPLARAARVADNGSRGG